VEIADEFTLDWIYEHTAAPFRVAPDLVTPAAASG